MNWQREQKNQAKGLEKRAKESDRRAVESDRRAEEFYLSHCFFPSNEERLWLCESSFPAQH